MSIEIGYVGLDHSHRDGFLRSLDALGVDVVAACEPNEAFDVESVEGLGDVPVYRDPGALLDGEEVDAVWVTLPNRDTPAVVEAAVDRGIDVFSEKTMARTADELAPVADAAAEAGVTVAAAYTWRTHHLSVDLREQIAAGRLGEVEAVDARWIATRLDSRLETPVGRATYDREASRGGILQWLGCHWIDLIPWLLDDPIARVCADVTRNHDAVDIDDGATVQFETRDGVVGTLQCGYYLREGYDTDISIYGTEGWSRSHGRDPDAPGNRNRLDIDSSREDWWTAPRRTVQYVEGEREGYFGRPGTRFIEEFLEACAGEGSVPAGIDDALQVLRVLDAAYESAETGGWIVV